MDGHRRGLPPLGGRTRACPGADAKSCVRPAGVTAGVAGLRADGWFTGFATKDLTPYPPGRQGPEREGIPTGLFTLDRFDPAPTPRIPAAATDLDHPGG